jgi:hypothetical protein
MCSGCEDIIEDANARLAPDWLHDIVAHCSRCGLMHQPHDGIDVRDPDDEAVACGSFHIERMDDDHVWLAVVTVDGRRLVVNLSSKMCIRMTMEVE